MVAEWRIVDGRESLTVEVVGVIVLNHMDHVGGKL
jgi:hypothetical protein